MPPLLLRLTNPFAVAFNGKYEDFREVFSNIVMAFALGSVVVLVGAQLAGYELSVVTEDLASYRSLTQATGLDRSYLHRDGRNTVASVTIQPL